MITLEFSFPAGRYHATPWDSQVNEGLVEWPPSPWRLLRSLIATWHFKAQADIPEADLQGLIAKLSGSLPVFGLPVGQVTLSHTRHFMPLYRTPLDGKTSKIFDTFIRLSHNGPILAAWEEVDLSPKEQTALQTLVERMGYLGRGESWVDGKVSQDFPGEINAMPLSEDEPVSPDEERIRLLAPCSESEYAIWREGYLQGIQQGRKVGKKASSELPPNVFMALQTDTATLKKQGWNQPPGSKFVFYRIPKLSSSLRVKKSPSRDLGTLPNVARYAVSSAAPPRLTEAISVAERVRRSLMARSDGAKVFAGKDENSMPLSGHQHTHIFCESHGRKGQITHVTLYAPMGFSETDLKAIANLERVWGRGGHNLQLVYLGSGASQDFAGLSAKQGECPLFASSRVWVSLTPFVPTHLPKYNRNGKPRMDGNGLQLGSPEHDLRRLLQLGGKPEPMQVDPLAHTYLGNHKTYWLEYLTSRKEESQQPHRGYGFRIVFPEPVTGPLAVGYGCHFGLGLFVPGE